VTDYAQPYAPPPPPPAVAGPPRTRGAAITALIFGLLALIPCCFPAGLLSLILGLIAVGSIGRSQGRLTGAGLAWVGLLLGLLGLIGWTVASVTMAPKALRFYAGMGQAATASEEIFAGLRADDIERAYQATGEGYRAAHPRAEFEARLRTLLSERGSLANAQMTNLDQTTWFGMDEGDTFTTTIEYTLEWSNGGTTIAVLVWEWPWYDDLERLPEPDLESITFD